MTFYFWHLNYLRIVYSGYIHVKCDRVRELTFAHLSTSLATTLRVASVKPTSGLHHFLQNHVGSELTGGSLGSADVLLESRVSKNIQIFRLLSPSPQGNEGFKIDSSLYVTTLTQI